ncbi:MAG: antA/AntB antirepressor family protein [Prevotellaceae bacterium]|jgi:phage anti-repressor protein|nr:antA/AntB antirepressor family protein [Prevotellaceae bacterium]
MNDLITICFDSEKPTVNVRELHAALEVETRYNDWFARMCEYGFVEGKDHYSVLSNGEGFGKAAVRTDHKLTVSMAKEICMLQRTPKGKQFREYFISVEEAWNTPEKIMERALQIAHERAVEAEKRVFGLLEEKEDLEIALNSSLNYYTVAKYNSTHKMGWNMRKCQEIGRKMTHFCNAHHYKIQKCKTNDERFGETNSYPLTAWTDFLGGSENG